MPFTCDVCGLGSAFPDQIPAVGDLLRCRHCGGERPFVRPPLLIVTGATAVGKSIVCARLAGTIRGAVLLDADVHAGDLVSVAPPNQDYPGFWRSMMRLVHEIAQNDVAVVYFATMLPEQVLVNADLLRYFESAHFLCLTCPADLLRARLAGRGGSDPGEAGLDRWIDFDAALVAAAEDLPTATALDVDRSADRLEDDVRHWLHSRLQAWERPKPVPRQ